MPRMRTIEEAIKLLRQEDPGCQLTKHALRQMVLAGQVPFVQIGKTKRLINVDALLVQLGAPQSGAPAEPQNGIVRAVPERIA